MTRTLKKISKFTASIVVFVFGLNMVITPVSFAQAAFLPAAGSMVGLTAKFNPMIVKGVKLYPDNPFRFDFIVDAGDANLSQDQMKDQGQKLISYFLASLTTPEKEMWVNLSPYEKQRIIPTSFGQTEMGMQLLAQDYMLKQIMATALYPEKELGKEFWKKVYAQAQEKFGTTDVPINTFNKVWIVPAKAVVYENAQTNSVFVVESSLKVMLEQDYLAANKNKAREQFGLMDLPKVTEASAISSAIIKEIVVPALEKEVNEGKNFAALRQVYNSLILAAWYKNNLKNNVLAKAYVDRGKNLGVDVQDKEITQKIYHQYLRAYRKGVFNYIKEDIDSATQTVIPHKYFSGGENFAMLAGMINKQEIFGLKGAEEASRAMTASRHLLRIVGGAALAIAFSGAALGATSGTHGAPLSPTAAPTATITQSVSSSGIDIEKAGSGIIQTLEGRGFSATFTLNAIGHHQITVTHHVSPSHDIVRRVSLQNMDQVVVHVNDTIKISMPTTTNPVSGTASATTSTSTTTSAGVAPTVSTPAITSLQEQINGFDGQIKPLQADLEKVRGEIAKDREVLARLKRDERAARTNFNRANDTYEEALKAERQRSSSVYWSDEWNAITGGAVSKVEQRFEAAGKRKIETTQNLTNAGTAYSVKRYLLDPELKRLTGLEAVDIQKIRELTAEKQVVMGKLQAARQEQAASVEAARQAQAGAEAAREAQVRAGQEAERAARQAQEATDRQKVITEINHVDGSIQALLDRANTLIAKANNLIPEDQWTDSMKQARITFATVEEQRQKLNAEMGQRKNKLGLKALKKVLVGLETFGSQYATAYYDFEQEVKARFPQPIVAAPPAPAIAPALQTPPAVVNAVPAVTPPAKAPAPAVAPPSQPASAPPAVNAAPTERSFFIRVKDFVNHAPDAVVRSIQGINLWSKPTPAVPPAASVTPSVSAPAPTGTSLQPAATKPPAPLGLKASEQPKSEGWSFSRITDWSGWDHLTWSSKPSETTTPAGASSSLPNNHPTGPALNETSKPPVESIPSANAKPSGWSLEDIPGYVVYQWIAGKRTPSVATPPPTTAAPVAGTVVQPPVTKPPAPLGLKVSEQPKSEGWGFSRITEWSGWDHLTWSSKPSETTPADRRAVLRQIVAPFSEDTMGVLDDIGLTTGAIFGSEKEHTNARFEAFYFYDGMIKRSNMSEDQLVQVTEELNKLHGAVIEEVKDASTPEERDTAKSRLQTVEGFYNHIGIALPGQPDNWSKPAEAASFKPANDWEALRQTTIDQGIKDIEGQLVKMEAAVDHFSSMSLNSPGLSSGLWRHRVYMRTIYFDLFDLDTEAQLTQAQDEAVRIAREKIGDLSRRLFMMEQLAISSQSGFVGDFQAWVDSNQDEVGSLMKSIKITTSLDTDPTISPEVKENARQKAQEIIRGALKRSLGFEINKGTGYIISPAVIKQDTSLLNFKIVGDNGIPFNVTLSLVNPVAVPVAPAAPVTQDHAMKGGIDLEKTNVQTRGAGVRTVFSDPAMLRMLLNADGLVPVIYKIEPAAPSMINMLLGLNTASASVPH